MIDERAENTRKSEMLMGLLQLPYNRTCADCGFLIGEGLVKAYSALGVFICLYCSECHTSVLPLSICAIKSVDGYSMNMRLARWSYSEIRNMARWGNRRANAYWAATLPHNPRWGNHRFITKAHREAHIKAKYKLKTWVVPHSSPSFNCYEDVELKMLHDRGFGYKTFSYPRSSIAPSMDNNHKNGDISVVTIAQSNPSSPCTPSVRLPPVPKQENIEETYTYTRASTPTPISESATSSPEQSVHSLPGIGWAEKWKAKKEFLKTVSEVESGTKTSGTFRGEITDSTNSISTLTTTTSVAPSPSPKRNYYRVKIPPPSLHQLNRYGALTRSNRMIPIERAYPESIHPSGMWVFSSSAFSQPRHNRKHSSGLRSYSMQPLVDAIHEHAASEEHDIAEQHKAVVDIVWQGLVPTKFEGPQSPPLESKTLLDERPIFPFLESDEKAAFTFESALPANIGMPKAASQPIQEVPSVSPRAPTTRYPGCPKWNYYFKCAVSDGQSCRQPHICELCGSPEHRAAQHWHHLATAPLPEIQARPKLSTPSAPPESPSLKATKDRVPLSVPSYSDHLSTHVSQSAVATPGRIPLFVPPYGLSQTQKVAAQAERLKYRRKLSKSKITPSFVEEPEINKEIPEVDKSDTIQDSSQIKIKIMAPRSPSSKPVEVILPPPVRPFQRSSTPCKPSDASLPGGEKANVSSPLRVTAPPFEPSHIGAWTPPQESSYRFSDLFQIPSRESKKIEIVAPKRKGKEALRPLASQGSMISHKSNTNSKYRREIPRAKEKESSTSTDGLRGVVTHSNSVQVNAFTTSLSTNTISQQSVQQHEKAATTNENAIPSKATPPNLDRNVLAMLNENLDAVIGGGSEETVVATLEAMIEICSSPRDLSQPTQSSQYQSHSQFKPWLHYEPNFNPFYHSNSPWQPYVHSSFMHNPYPYSLESSSTEPFIAFGDFTEDDELNQAIVLSASQMHYQRGQMRWYHDQHRPQSAVSSSTAPLDPNNGSPPTPLHRGSDQRHSSSLSL